MIHSTHDAPSHSRLACKAFCDRKYFYRYHLGLEGKQRFAPAFAGSCGHVGLEAYHRSGDRQQALSKASEAWGSEHFHGDWDYLTAGHLECVLKNYMESDHTQDWKVVRLKRSDLQEDRLLATDVEEDDEGYLVLAESSFVVDVEGMGAINVRPDLLLEVATGLRVVDHKLTTGYLGSRLYNTGKYTHQLRLYALAVSSLLGESVLEGAVNAIHMGKKASSPKFGGQRFDNYVYDYTESDFEETKAWYTANRRSMERYDEHFTDDDDLAAPQNAGEHCGRCDFNVLCSVAPRMRPMEMKRNFARRVNDNG